MKKLVFPPLSLFEASTAKVGRHPCSEFAVAPGKHLFFVHDEWVQPLLQKFAADSADYGCVSVRRAGSDGVQATTAATPKEWRSGSHKSCWTRRFIGLGSGGIQLPTRRVARVIPCELIL